MLGRQGEACATRLQAEKAHRYLPLLPAPSAPQGVEAGLVPARGQEGTLLQPGLLHKHHLCPDRGKAHLPWWPSSIGSAATSSPGSLLTPCVPRRSPPAPGRLSQSTSCSSIMNFEQGDVFGFYKYAVTTRLYTCRAEPEWEGQTEGQRSYGEMAQDAQGQMPAAGGIQYARQNLRATIEKLVTRGTARADPPWV